MVLQIPTNHNGCEVNWTALEDLEVHELLLAQRRHIACDPRQNGVLPVEIQARTPKQGTEEENREGPTVRQIR